MGQLAEEVEKLVSPLLAEGGIELVDVTYLKWPNGWTLTFFLDKPGGVTLDDCERWSHRLSERLDQADLIPHAYNLEVSSPGLNRPLKRTADFERFTGETVQVRLFAPLEGRKNFRGKLVGATDDDIRVALDDGKREAVLPRQQIAKAVLDPDIEI